MSDRLHASKLIRILLWSCGALALVVGTLGIFLPGLPTTPFAILAAACFVRASPRAHAWLLNHRFFGPLLRDWEEHHTVPRRVKIIALSTMAISVTASIFFFSGRPWLQTGIFLAAAAGAVAIALIPSRK